MDRQRTPKSMCEDRTLTREDVWQDKSRKARGGRKSEEANKCNLLAQGAHAPITLLNGPSHWQCGDLCTLQVDAS